MNSALQERAAATLERLGIPSAIVRKRSLPLCAEAQRLVVVEVGKRGRKHQLTPAAARAWKKMKAAAAKDGIGLAIVSAFRSFDYQRALIQRKLDNGRAIAEVLKINAAPGYSEHHTGRALDITAPDCQPLEQGFETTRAFAWLTQHAGSHGFRLSYPRDNPHGISYEPWHWAYIG